MTLKEAVHLWNLKREDNPRHRATVEQCYAMRKHYPLHGRVRIYGVEAEVISHPFPSSYGASVKLREPGNPMTLVEAAVNPAAFEEA